MTIKTVQTWLTQGATLFNHPALDPKGVDAIIAGRPLTMAPGDTYRWRGGYCIQAPDVQSANFDSTFLYHTQGAPKTALVKTASDYIQLD